MEFKLKDMGMKLVVGQLAWNVYMVNKKLEVDSLTVT